MSDIAIERHSFDLAKNRLKEFSEKTEAELEIGKVRTTGDFFGRWGDHKVTGDELNTRLETIQGHFIAVNTTNNKVIKEFREVYNALDALDKDYITSIVANVKAIEKTSNDVRMQQGTLKQHNEKLANQQTKLDAHQTEIEKNVANVSKIVTALKVFKEKLEGYKHLTDIDKIWNDCKTIQNEIQVVSNSITNFSKKATEEIAVVNNKNKALSEQVNQDILTLHNEAKSFKEFFSNLSEKIEWTVDLLNKQIPVIQETSSFSEQLKNIAHINDVDFMWNDLDLVKEDIRKINGIIEENRENIQLHQNKLDTLATTSSEHKESINTLFKKLADADEYAVNSRNFITDLESFRIKLATLNHLMEVDEIWKQTEDYQLRIKRVEQEGKSHTDKLNELVQVGDRMHKSIDTNTHDINSLKEYKDKLSCISHLDDVDSMWTEVEEHTSQLIEGEKRNKELAATIQKNKDEVDKNIAVAVRTANAAVESLTNKVKYAYWIAGCSAGLAIIELILLLMKVI